MSKRLWQALVVMLYGQFEGIEVKKPIGELLYIYLKPDDNKPVSIKPKDLTSDQLADQALSDFKDRLALYAKPDQGYLSWAAAHLRTERGGDYDHLARLYEWDTLGVDDDEDDGEEGEACE
jgi:ATP-dependent helicase/nuclease subunit B